MDEGYKQQLDKLVDTAIEKEISSLPALEKRALELRKILKAEITPEKASDQKITMQEWSQIFESIPKELLDEFRISTPLDLRIFVVPDLYAEELIKKHGKDELAEKILEHRGRRYTPYLYKSVFELKPTFFKSSRMWDFFDLIAEEALSPESLKSLRASDILDHSDKISKQKNAEKILLAAAKDDPISAMHNVEKYMDEPYAEKMLNIAVELKPREMSVYARKFMHKEYFDRVAVKAISALKRLDEDVYVREFLKLSRRIGNKPYIKGAFQGMIEGSGLANFISASSILKFAGIYKDEPYADDFFKQVVQKFPLIMLSTYDKDIPKKYLYETIKKLRDQKKYYFLQACAKKIIKFCPPAFAKKVIFEAVSKGDLNKDVIKHCSKTPFIGELLDTIIEQYRPEITGDSNEILRAVLISGVKDSEKYLKKLFEKISTRSLEIELAIEIHDRFPELIDESVVFWELRNQASMDLCAQYPDLLFYNLSVEEQKAKVSSFLSNYPANPSYYISTLLKVCNEKTPFIIDAILKMAERCPKEVFECYSDIQDKPYKKHLMERAARNLKEKDSWRILSLEGEKKLFSNLTIGRAMMAEANMGYQMMSSYTHFLNRLSPKSPFIKNAVTALAESDSETVLGNTFLFSKMPYAGDVIEKAAKIKPKLALKMFKPFKSEPYAEKVLKEIAVRYPQSVLSESGNFMNEPYGKEIIKSCLMYVSPEKMGRYLGMEVPENLMDISDKKREFIDKNIEKFYGTVRILIAKNEDKKLEKLNKDVALKGFDKVNVDWLDPKPDLSMQAEYKAMIARNLFFQKKPVNKLSVKAEYSRIIETRGKIRNLPLFKGRNVLMLAHLEKLSVGSRGYRFAKDQTVNAIERQSKKFQLIRPENDGIDELKKKKIAVFDSLRATKSPFTFVFDGHGFEDAIFLSKGQITGGAGLGDPKEKEKAIKITVDELANVLIERAHIHNQEGKIMAERDILVFSACYNHSFVRKLYSRLRESSSMDLPITLGGSEHGQYAYSTLHSPYGSDFFAKVLNLENPNSITTFGTVIDNEQRYIDSNPSLYIPSEEGGIMQVAKANPSAAQAAA